MASSEIMITCPTCSHRTTLPIAAVKRDNFFCAQCLNKVPLAGVRTVTGEGMGAPPRPKRS